MLPSWSLGAAKCRIVETKEALETPEDKIKTTKNKNSLEIPFLPITE
jgi:hypothetical protein